MKIKKEEYITLKEAAEISGYAPDYVGQLIRQGKITGKQVFSNVSWVTTEEALHAYMEGETSGKSSGKSRRDAAAVVMGGMNIDEVHRLYTYISRAVLVVLGIFALLLVYVLSVSIDQRIENSFLERIEHAQ